MTKKSNGSKPALRFELDKDAKWGGFINVRMDEDMTNGFQSWFDQLDTSIDAVLDELIAWGLKVSYSFDAQNNCVICSFTGRLVEESQDRYVVSSRAATVLEAGALMCWKHLFVVRGDYGKYRPKTDSGFNWG